MMELIVPGKVCSQGTLLEGGVMIGVNNEEGSCLIAFLDNGSPTISYNKLDVINVTEEEASFEQTCWALQMIITSYYRSFFEITEEVFV